MKEMNAKLDETRILSEEEVAQMTKALRKLLREEFPSMPPGFLSSAEDTVRMHSLCSRFRQARESMSLTFKEVATRLKVPQYRLKAVEEGHLSEIDSTVFTKYSDFLELEQWVSRWVESNGKLATKLGIGYIKG
jgi:hypothetical protein